MFLGIVGVVLGSSKIHASVIADPAYDFTSSFRFPWALLLCGLLAAAAYSVGLPDVPNRARQIAAASVVAVVAGVAGVSVAQSLTGSALLPRFVLVTSSVALLPVFVGCAVLAHGGRQRAKARDRVVVVGAQEDSRTLVHQLDGRAERPGEVVALLTPDEAMPEPGRLTPIRDAVDGPDG